MYIHDGVWCVFIEKMNQDKGKLQMDQHMCVGHLQFLFWVSLGLLLINRNCKVVCRSQLKNRRHILDN